MPMAGISSKSSPEDSLLTAEDLARRLNVSADWVSNDPYCTTPSLQVLSVAVAEGFSCIRTIIPNCGVTPLATLSFSSTTSAEIELNHA
jgi:hypothetical protein